jgi:hypothetical protein
LTMQDKIMSVVDTANKMTKDFLKSHQITPNPQPKQTLAETRKKQGEGMYQADIGD